MNIVLFEPEETELPLSRNDPRAQHILNILGRREGDPFDAGVVNGRRGKARVKAISEESIGLEFSLDHEDPPLYPVDLIVGLSRPQTNRKILRGSDFTRSSKHFLRSHGAGRAVLRGFQAMDLGRMETAGFGRRGSGVYHAVTRDRVRVDFGSVDWQA